MEGPLHGPLEAFDQDSTYLLRGLAAGEFYRWNPQNHLLYHVLVESGFRAWEMLFGPGLESAFRYLKLFTAVSGFLFLWAMRWLLVELGLALIPRLVLLFLTGISVSVWFHAAAFETHCIGLAPLAVYLRSLVRLRAGAPRTPLDRALFVGSLAVMGWTRVDLFRFAVVSSLLLVVPALRSAWRRIGADLGVAALIAVAGCGILAAIYFEVPFHHAMPTVLERRDRPWLKQQLSQVENLTPPNLARVARATTFYSMMMPIAGQPPDRGFFAPPTYVMGVEWPRDEALSARLFSKSLRNVLGNGLALFVALGLAGFFAVTAVASVRGAARGDPLHVVLLGQVIAGWLLYTWFDPWEPFLWVVEFLPLWVVLFADWLRGRGAGALIATAVLSAALALHNWHAFYLPFR